ncbi:MAG: protein translocase subunit SecD [Chloroflexi bacterium]|nr:protein translocase subunit SecD [Chloroflexota bacterium]
MSSHVRWLILIIVLTLFCIWVVLPETQGIHLDTDGDGKDDISLNVQQSLGLDLVGGLRVLLQSQLPPGSFSPEDLRTTANNVERRVNALGVGEATVQVQGNHRILVELPGVRDPQQAIETIQRTALLEFVDFSGLAGQAQQLVGQKILTTEQVLIQQQRQSPTAETTPEATAGAEPTAEATASAGDTSQIPTESQPLLNPATGQPFQTVMTGSGLQAAAARLSQGGRWEIQFELTPEGGKIFGPFTGARIGQPLAIVLDGVVLSAPTIEAQLDTGGVITGQFTEEEAKTLALQLRSGALPIPLEVISSETVGATLGQQSVNLSIRAGVIGVMIILAFMTINYRVPGIAASLGLLVFVLLNMAIFKFIPVTLTLPAIVGFLISIGSAVDGNILIFERMREELRAGKDVEAAVREGFSRAWNSIRDSNISTILISAVLFLFGQTPGASIVSGFAVTLALGLTLNLFTAIIVTRTFLHVLLTFLKRPAENRRWLMGV